MRLNARRTFAETAKLLGVSEAQVQRWVEAGPLVARVQADGSALIREDDLVAFRRPLGLASDNNSPLTCSEPYQSGKSATAGVVLAATGNNSLIIGRSESFGSRRGTMATKGFRALADVADVRRQSDRFFTFVSPEPNTGCHLWTGCFDKRHGYGQFKLWPARVIAMAHRVAWVLANGLLPERSEVDHLCHQRSCVNLRHLEAVSHAENIRRRDIRRASLGLGDNLTIARASRRLRLVRS